MTQTPVYDLPMPMAALSSVHVSVLGLYISTEERLEVPSSPPTTYIRPSWVTTPEAEIDTCGMSDRQIWSKIYNIPRYVSLTLTNKH